jgi:integrase
VASIQKREDRAKPYRVLYRDPVGKQRSQSFAKKKEAEGFASTVEADKVRGVYIDPAAGKVTFAEFAEDWLARQTTDPSTIEATASRLRTHLLPTFGSMSLVAIKPSHVQTWLKGCQRQCAPTFVRVLLASLSAILAAAQADQLIANNPCSSPVVKPPRLHERRLVPWTAEQIGAIVAAHADPYRAVPVVAFGCGLRQGEVFGLRVEDVDFLRRRILVRRQVKQLGGRPAYAPPKGGRERQVPLPDAVAVALAERLRDFPAREVTLPWRERDGRPVTVPLVFTSRESRPINRNHYNPYVWKPALVSTGIEPSREHGMHMLRHSFASTLLEGGVSIRAVAAFLGHRDPGFTLRTYAHLMPTSEDRARSVVDAALGPRAGSETDRPGEMAGVAEGSPHAGVAQMLPNRAQEAL